MKRLMARPLGFICTLGLCACSAVSSSPSTQQPAVADLNFRPQAYQRQQINVDGQTLVVRAYEGIVYVKNPVDTVHQRMNIYVPEAYFQGGSVGAYTAQTAPVFFPNQVGGYMPGLPGTAQPAAEGPGAGRPGTVAAALLRGYVVASPGARGRTAANGKAPAAIVDLKAAVRYLRFNDPAMPGDAEKIISNGTSAGGALSALLGASGNHPDYEPYLQALGAAAARDDVFAVSAYCPITNLEHADAAYEWLFGGVNDYKKIELSMLDYKVQRKEVAGTLTPAQIAVSAALKPTFPAYLNGLNLKSPQGQPLTLDASGNGSFKAYVKAQLIASAQKALDAGNDLSAHTWLTVSHGRVQGLDWNGYVRDAGRMKTPPAFDALDLSSGENQLFGTEQVDKQHFTPFAMQHSSSAGATVADARTVKMMNPMHYIGATQARNATHWRIRHGSMDRDTSLAIPVILATRLQNQGHAVDLALPWGRPHSGDYDLPELFVWMAKVSGQK